MVRLGKGLSLAQDSSSTDLTPPIEQQYSLEERNGFRFFQSTSLSTIALYIALLASPSPTMGGESMQSEQSFGVATYNQTQPAPIPTVLIDSGEVLDDTFASRMAQGMYDAMEEGVDYADSESEPLRFDVDGRMMTVSFHNNRITLGEQGEGETSFRIVVGGSEAEFVSVTKGLETIELSAKLFANISLSLPIIYPDRSGNSMSVIIDGLYTGKTFGGKYTLGKVGFIKAKIVEG